MLSPRVHELYVKRYGHSFRIRGLGPWDDRLLTLDPVSIAHVLKNSTVYEKPWQSRRLITSLIGCGMLAAEGDAHRRQRRIATPAFGLQNLRALVPMVWAKGHELRDKISEIIETTPNAPADFVSEKCDSKPKCKGVKIDVCDLISRATFDVIGLAGFDYRFNAIQGDSNELFCAYKDMFEVAISQGQGLRCIANVYFPILETIWPDKTTYTVRRAHEVINRVAGTLIQEKKAQLAAGTAPTPDLLTRLLASNTSTDIPPEQRISDADVLHNINTFLFAGSDTTSLALTWTLYLLAQHPAMQRKLRAELLSLSPPEEEGDEALADLHAQLAKLPYLNNVVRESLRLIPPVHSSLRVATRDDVIPTSTPLYTRSPTSTKPIVHPAGARAIHITKGSMVHVPIEGFNLAREVWGDNAWEFVPDRWDALPPAALAQPGLLPGLLTFSAGPRSCIGMRFSLIEMKVFLWVLLRAFVFTEGDETVIKRNVVLTRPYMKGRRGDGSMCPLWVRPYMHGEDDDPELKVEE
ncbi:hypothetical protein HWV62_19013 [Athelia sp. TMB]|nr:hypothetical protein HWV62_19013 [Athelia sp. TMB]